MTDEARLLIMKILLVEDSERLRRSLCKGLGREGFTVDTAADGAQGYEFSRRYEYDVIILDLMLPKIPGLDLLRRLRREGVNCPILILSAKDQIEDRVTGLELGADDYLIKPFAFDELCARLRTLARRQHTVRDPKIQLGPICVDTARRQVKRENCALPLTPSEYQLLEILALRRGRVISKERFRDWLYDSDTEVSSNVIEVLMSSLRKKLRSAGAAEIVQTRRGFGYLVEKDDSLCP